MPSNEALDDARTATMEIAHEPAWQGFGEYCNLRAQGLRKPALRALDKFIAQARQWPYVERKRFTAWLAQRVSRETMQLDGHIRTFGVLLPQPLFSEIVQPTLREWRSREAASAEPWLWSALLNDVDLMQDESQEQHLRRALLVDPACERAREHLIDILIGYVDYQQHHLPVGYIGSSEKSLVNLGEARTLSQALPPALRKRVEASLSEVEALTLDWMAFWAEGGGDFAQWCSERDKAYAWVKSYSYRSM